MNKKWIIIALALILGTSGIGYYLMRSTEEESITKPQPNDLPMLAVLQTDGNRIFLRDAPGNVVFIFFNPDCDHCQREATQIRNRKEIFKNHQVYFISIDIMPNISKFASDYGLIDNNFHFCRAESADVYQSVGPLPSVPAIFIYKDKRFVKKLEGEVSLDELAKFL